MQIRKSDICTWHVAVPVRSSVSDAQAGMARQGAAISLQSSHISQIHPSSLQERWHVNKAGPKSPGGFLTEAPYLMLLGKKNKKLIYHGVRARSLKINNGSKEKQQSLVFISETTSRVQGGFARGSALQYVQKGLCCKANLR